MSIIELTSENIEYLSNFLNNDIPITFRYFNNKIPKQIIKNHYKTIIYIENEKPIGYAHIDYDIINNKYWFGICVLSDYHNKGIGTKLITTIIEYFNNSDIDTLHLTVDKSNIIAYNIYLKNGFTLERETEDIYIMSLSKSNILYLPVSFGEAIDKLTILDIKMNKITDIRKNDVEIEYNKLNSQLKNIVTNIKFYYNALKHINLQIWEDQDKFRYSINDNEKNQLCKKIIEDNDARFRIKNKINNFLNSSLKEQKGYNPKIFSINYSSDINNFKLIISIIKYQSIFNDKVYVYCFPEQLTTLKALFNYDLSINIIPSLTIEVTTEYINNIISLINNISFYNFILNEI